MTPTQDPTQENRMKPYKHTDVDGEHLRIEPTEHGSAWLTAVRKDTAVIHDLPASEVPAAALALYEAAGLPEPVILERPTSGSASLVSEGGGELVTVSASPRGGPMNLPGVMLSTGGVGVRLIRDEPLRLAWQLVGAMREAEAEPDPAELEQLATVIHRANCKSGQRCVQKPDDTDLVAARAVLLARWKREQQS